MKKTIIGLAFLFLGSLITLKVHFYNLSLIENISCWNSSLGRYNQGLVNNYNVFLFLIGILLFLLGFVILIKEYFQKKK